MNKIEQLIKEKCPNGVKYFRLSDICEKFNGLSGKTKTDFKDGNYRYITYTNIYNNPAINLSSNDFVHIKENEKQNEIKYKDILVAGSSENLEDSGMISVVTSTTVEKIYLNSFCFGLRLTSKYFDLYNADFLKHLFRSKQLRSQIIRCSFGVTRYNLSKDRLLKIKIPCPPIEVQEEIVKILDKFSELEEELEEELETRKQQYEFYKNKIFNSNIKKYKLGELCNIISGGTPSKKNNEYWENGNIKWLGSSVCKNKKQVDEITAYITDLGLKKSSAKMLQPGTTLIAMVGATIGKVSYLNFGACTNQNVAGLWPKNREILNAEYLFYACTNLYNKFLNLSKNGFAMANLRFIKNLEISLPSLQEQERIVKILNKFDKLINDISEGIPAEIETRRKQYEYYRNKLLSFEELRENK